MESMLASALRQRAMDSRSPDGCPFVLIQGNKEERTHGPSALSTPPHTPPHTRPVLTPPLSSTRRRRSTFSASSATDAQHGIEVACTLVRGELCPGTLHISTTRLCFLGNHTSNSVRAAIGFRDLIAVQPIGPTAYAPSTLRLRVMPKLSISSSSERMSLQSSVSDAALDDYEFIHVENLDRVAKEIDRLWTDHQRASGDVTLNTSYGSVPSTMSHTFSTPPRPASVCNHSISRPTEEDSTCTEQDLDSKDDLEPTPSFGTASEILGRYRHAKKRNVTRGQESSMVQRETRTGDIITSWGSLNHVVEETSDAESVQQSLSRPTFESTPPPSSSSSSQRVSKTRNRESPSTVRNLSTASDQRRLPTPLSAPPSLISRSTTTTKLSHAVPTIHSVLTPSIASDLKDGQDTPMSQDQRSIRGDNESVRSATYSIEQSTLLLSTSALSTDSTLQEATAHRVQGLEATGKSGCKCNHLKENESLSIIVFLTPQACFETLFSGTENGTGDPIIRKAHQRANGTDRVRIGTWSGPSMNGPSWEHSTRRLKYSVNVSTERRTVACLETQTVACFQAGIICVHADHLVSCEEYPKDFTFQSQVCLSSIAADRTRVSCFLDKGGMDSAWSRRSSLGAKVQDSVLRYYQELLQDLVTKTKHSSYSANELAMKKGYRSFSGTTFRSLPVTLDRHAAGSSRSLTVVDAGVANTILRSGSTPVVDASASQSPLSLLYLRNVLAQAPNGMASQSNNNNNNNNNNTATTTTTNNNTQSSSEITTTQESGQPSSTSTATTATAVQSVIAFVQAKIDLLDPLLSRSPTIDAKKVLEQPQPQPQSQPQSQRQPIPKLEKGQQGHSTPQSTNEVALPDLLKTYLNLLIRPFESRSRSKEKAAEEKVLAAKEKTDLAVSAEKGMDVIDTETDEQANQDVETDRDEPITKASIETGLVSTTPIELALTGTAILSGGRVHPRDKFFRRATMVVFIAVVAISAMNIWYLFMALSSMVEVLQHQGQIQHHHRVSDMHHHPHTEYARQMKYNGPPFQQK